MSVGWIVYGIVSGFCGGVLVGGWAERRRVRSQALMDAMRQANKVEP